MHRKFKKPLVVLFILSIFGGTLVVLNYLDILPIKDAAKKVVLSVMQAAATDYPDDLFINKPVIGLTSSWYPQWEVNFRTTRPLVTKVFYKASNLEGWTREYLSSREPGETYEYNIYTIPLWGRHDPDTKSSYKVCWKEVGASSFTCGPTHTLQNTRNPGKSFKFAIWGDSQQFNEDSWGNPLLRKMPSEFKHVIQTVIDYHNVAPYDFTVDVGDSWDLLQYQDKLKIKQNKDMSQEEALLSPQYWRDVMDPLSASVPHFKTNGNHEYDIEWTYREGADLADMDFPDIIKAHNAKYWSTIPYSSNAEPDPIDERYFHSYEEYYSWIWGDALFIVLDTEDFWFEDHKKYPYNQYGWLKRTLESSNKKWKFIIMHRPILNCDGGVDRDPCSDAIIVNLLHNLFKENGVNVVFQAHEHLYAHDVIDGIYYITTGWAGASPPTCSNTGKLKNMVCFRQHFLDIEVTPSQVRIKAIKGTKTSSEVFQDIVIR